MNLNLKRITLTGTTTKVEFKEVCGKWLVKNFTDADIYVSFEAGSDGELVEANAVKIKSNYGQIVIGNEELQYTNLFKTNAIYIKGTGEVEVQQLCFK
jgi:hypothetical protein